MLSEIISKWGGRPETPLEMYTDVFHLGEGFLQREGEPPGSFKGNPLIIGSDGKRMHRKIMFEDTFAETLAEFQGMEWAYMSGCTYFGRKNNADSQSKLYALIFDLDGVTESTLNNFFSGAITGGVYPVPQHVVLSGHGVHLYYVFDEPVDLYPDVKTQLKEMKYALTRRVWNRYTSNEENIQYQGINQAFRVPGSKTKPGAAVRVCQAFRLNDHPTTVEELNGRVPAEARVKVGRAYREPRFTADEARKRFPEWYQRVVVDGLRGQWIVKDDLYSWWLRRLRSDEVTYGHRYFCVMCLAIYAAKCGIYDRDRVRADALSLLPHFNSINPEKPFTEADVDSALDCLDGRYARFPRSEVERLTQILVPPNKRNGRKQALHLRMARSNLEILNEDAGHALQGRPKGISTKAERIRTYAADHPEANHSEIARALGVSRPTVIKWLKATFPQPTE